MNCARGFTYGTLSARMLNGAMLSEAGLGYASVEVTIAEEQ